MSNSVSLIRSTRLMASIPESHLKDLHQKGHIRIRHFGKGQMIHQAGDACTHLEILLDGQIIIDRIDENGNLMSIVSFGTNDLIGGNSLFASNNMYLMTITARTQLKVLSLDKETLLSLLSTYPEFLTEYLRQISDRAAILGKKLTQFTNRTIREKLIYHLSQLSLRQESDKVILECSKKALADRLGVQRTSISRELQKMVKARLIEMDGRNIHILSNELLDAKKDRLQ